MSEIMYSFILFLGLSLLGWIFVGIAVHTKRYQQKKELSERSAAPGKIVDVVKRVQPAGRGRPAVYYVPVVEFEADRRLYRLENENGSRNIEDIVIGRSVDVLYDENDPSHFHLADDDANEEAAHSLMRFGLIIIAGAAVLTVCNHVFHIF